MSKRETPLIWLNRAIQLAAGLTPAEVIVPGVGGWGSLPLAEPADVQMHPAYQVHAHAVNEICIAMFGTAAIVLQGQTYELKAPRLVVLPAKVEHGEGSLGQRPYHLLWVGLDPAGGCFAGGSSYRHGRGWRSRYRQRLSRLEGEHLFQSGGAESLDPMHWPKIQHELLAALLELHRAALPADRATSDQGAADHASIVADIQRYLRTHLTEPLRLDDVAHLVRLSPNYVNTLFQRHAGRTIHAWLLDLRMEKSMSLCRETNLPFKQIAADVGFNDALYFSKAFRRRFGLSPTEARDQASAR